MLNASLFPLIFVLFLYMPSTAKDTYLEWPPSIKCRQVDYDNLRLAGEKIHLPERMKKLPHHCRFVFVLFLLFVLFVICIRRRPLSMATASNRSVFGTYFNRYQYSSKLVFPISSDSTNFQQLRSGFY